MVAISDVSLMPQTSQIGRPMAVKNSSTSGAIGAAPETRYSTSIQARAALAQRREQLRVGPAWASAQLGVHVLARLRGPHHRERPRRVPRARPHAAPGRARRAKPASSAALSFSQTRGTAPHEVGRTSITAPITCVRSATKVTLGTRHDRL